MYRICGMCKLNFDLHEAKTLQRMKWKDLRAFRVMEK
jgi:hypothetical protein